MSAADGRRYGKDRQTLFRQLRNRRRAAQVQGNNGATERNGRSLKQTLNVQRSTLNVQFGAPQLGQKHTQAKQVRPFTLREILRSAQDDNRDNGAAERNGSGIDTNFTNSHENVRRIGRARSPLRAVN